MTFAKRAALALGLAGALLGCQRNMLVEPSTTAPVTTPTGPTNTGGTPDPTTPAGPQGSASLNIMQVTVNGSLCSAATTADIGYINKPCVSVTICQPGTTNCQTVNDILIDTGSYGLRIFPSGTNANGTAYNLSSLSLPTVEQSGTPVGTCAQFLDGSALWGPVVRADVILVSGGERASVPIELIEPTFGGATPQNCDDGQAAATAADAGFNGILGVGLWAQDCGTDCDPNYVQSVQASGLDTSFYPYYTCTGTSCTQALVSLANQVTNPVTAFPVNNNGLVFELPAVPFAGAVSVSGSIILGIGTGADNAMPGFDTTYTADANATFATVFDGNTYSDSSSDTSVSGSFIDSGSNTYSFTAPSTVNCCAIDSSGNLLSSTVACTDSTSSGFLCPASSFPFSAMNEGVGYSTGSPSGAGVTINGSVANYFTLSSSSSMVFSDVATADVSCSSTSPCSFDFGLPFFLGRSIYVGYQKLSGTSLVTQGYWAY